MLARSSRNRIAIAVSVIGLVAATGCSTKSSGSSSGGSSGSSQGVKTGSGVTADTISLGELTDLSGPFASAGKSATQAQQLYYDQVSAGGGVCGRKIATVVKDHAYNVQNAVTQYQQIKDQVVAIPQLLGSPQTAALLSNITADKMVVIPSANVSSLLVNREVMIAGTTYDYEMINLIDYAIAHKLIQKGDKVGHIYLGNEGGANALRGSRYAGDKTGVTIIPVKVQTTDIDLTTQVTDLKDQGVKAIAYTSSPFAAASAVGVDAAIGLNVPVLATDPSFVPGLLKTNAGPALQKLMYLAASSQPLNTTEPGTSKFIADYKSKYPSAALDGGVVTGYGAAKAFVEVLKKACDSKDLTREGVTAAFKSLSDVTTGALAPLTYSTPGASPSQKVHIFRPDASTVGGLKEVSNGLYEGPTTADYKGPAVK